MIMLYYFYSGVYVSRSQCSAQKYKKLIKVKPMKASFLKKINRSTWIIQLEIN